MCSHSGPRRSTFTSAFTLDIAATPRLARIIFWKMLFVTADARVLTLCEYFKERPLQLTCAGCKGM